MRAVFQYRLALQDRGDGVEVCWIAERMDQNEAVELVFLVTQIREAQPERGRIGVEKYGLHAGRRDRLPDHGVREDRHAYASASGGAKRPKQGVLCLSSLPGGKDVDSQALKRRKPGTPEIRKGLRKPSKSSPDLLPSIGNVIGRDHRLQLPLPSVARLLCRATNRQLQRQQHPNPDRLGGRRRAVRGKVSAGLWIALIHPGPGSAKRLVSFRKMDAFVDVESCSRR